MMEFLLQRQTVKDNGKYKSAPRALYLASSVYYMHNRDQIRTFLEDARICSHTNDVERSQIINNPPKECRLCPVHQGKRSVVWSSGHLGNRQTLWNR
ncbi:hypothetical protein [uncultured Turicimonas sp.]|uniref:hypothetical protein n=2 Tax=uncultured Turicimonas sp. TaxID=1918607 RepID=UPI003211B614